jgi:transcriptional regulator with XRE-family HTH domain
MAAHGEDVMAADTFRLAQVRRSQARTQLEVAREMGVSQSRVSSIERGEMSRTELGTLDAYVSAMGGRLRVVAEFEDGTVALH